VFIIINAVHYLSSPKLAQGGPLQYSEKIVG